jgi:hypothetical protein
MVAAVDQPAEDGMVMSEDILRQPGKAGKNEGAEEAVETTKMTTIKDQNEVVAEIQAAMKAEVGSEMKKDIRKQQGKAGNIVAVEGAAIMMMMTIIKALRGVVEAEAVTMMKKTMTTRDLQAGAAQEVTVTMTTTTAIKDRHAAAEEVRAVAKVEVGSEMKRVTRKQQGKDGRIGAEEEAVAAMRTIIKDLHVVEVEVRAVAKVEVGSEMRRVTLKQQGKDGGIGVEEEAVAAMRTIIKDLHVVEVEVRAVGKAEDGMVMKKNIPGQQDAAGEIAIELGCNLKGVH